MTRKKTATPLMAASAAAALLLAGCSSASSGGDEASQQDTASESPANVVYDFPLNGMPPVSEGETLTIKLPEDLKETAGEDMAPVIVDSYEVTSRELDSTKNCAVDVKVNLASDEARQTAIDYYKDSGTYGSGTDGQKIGLVAIEMANVSTLDSLDEESPRSGVYASDDGSQMVLVEECAKSPTDQETGFSVAFPYYSEDHAQRGFSGERGAMVNFAGADIAVMTDGTVSVASGEIKNWTRDSSGNWIED